MMKNATVLQRLKTIEGHIRGIERMIEEDAYCIDVIQQIQAVQAALNRINTMVLENHIHSCVITAVRGEDSVERERVLAELSTVFDAAMKT